MRLDESRLGWAGHGNRFPLWLAFVVALSLGPASQSLGQITYNVTYQDVVSGSGIGFDATNNGATRRATVDAMFTYLATQIDGRGTANITWNVSQNDGTGFLATFGPRGLVGQVGSFQNGAVYNRLRSGGSTFGNPDGEGTMDFGSHNGKFWNNGTGAPASNQYDLYTVALHEVLHGHGFLSYTGSDGKGIYDNALGTPDLYAGFDKFIQRGNVVGSGGLLNTTITSANYGSFIGDVTTLTNGNNASTGLFFGGKYATEIYGGAVPLYAPGTYVGGSSTSHDTGASPTGVMSHSIPSGTMRRTLQPYEVGMLIDMGYNTYNWNGNTTGNWSSGSTAGTLASSNWRTDMGITRNAANTTSYNMNSAQAEAPVLAPYGQVTSNIVLNFRGSGASAYTSTNDLGTFRLSRITLDSTASVTNTITGGTLVWGQNSDATSAVMIAAIEQKNTGAFNINSTMQIPNGLTVRGSGTGSVNLGGNISGAGGFTKNGSFSVTLSGTNSYTGNTTINGGTLTMADGAASALGSNTGALTIAGGTLEMRNNNVTVGNLTGGSGATIQGNSGTRTLTIGNGGGGGGNFQGTITNGAAGTQNLTKTGAGTITLSGNNTYTGATSVIGGTLLVHGSLAAASAVTVSGSARFGGTGTVAGALAATGTSTIAPGASPGSLELGSTFSLGSTSILEIELGGTAFSLNGTEEYDRLKVTGTTTLFGTLDVSLSGGFTLGNGEVFGVLDAVGGLSGTFANYNEGATLFSNSGYDLKITYLGAIADSGTPLLFGGSDVVLYTVAVPEPGTLAMMAGGIVSLWVTRRRWRSSRWAPQTLGGDRNA